MRTDFRFQPRKLAAVLLMGGVLLAPLASHGCDAKGTSPKLDPPTTAMQLLPEPSYGAAFLPTALYRLE